MCLKWDNFQVHTDGQMDSQQTNKNDKNDNKDDKVICIYTRVKKENVKYTVRKVMQGGRICASHMGLTWVMYV